MAGAGHSGKSNESISVFCPGYSKGSISVATTAQLCDERIWPDNSTLVPKKGLRPPGAFWIDWTQKDVLIELIGKTVEDSMWFSTFCGGNDCMENSHCRDHRNEIYWPMNVSDTKAAPDVLAPSGYPYEQPVIHIDLGTSFATATVTGVLGSIISELRNSGFDPVPRDLHRSVKLGGDELEDVDIPRLNAEQTIEIFL